jgi:hypothetical protein
VTGIWKPGGSWLLIVPKKYLDTAAKLASVAHSPCLMPRQASSLYSDGVMGSRYEFDKEHKILLVYLDGRLSEESLGSLNRAGEKYWAATNPCAEIIDCSRVTAIAISSERIRQLAKQQLNPDAIKRHRVIIVPAVHAFGLARMYQITGERNRPLTTVVRTMNGALEALKITSPHFEPLD